MIKLICLLLTVYIGNLVAFNSFGVTSTLGFVGQQNQSSSDSSEKWVNKYGYFVTSHNEPKKISGENTEGLKVDYLFTSEKIFPYRDFEDNRPVLVVKDIMNFLLSQVKDIDEAIKLILSYQIVASNIAEEPSQIMLRDINEQSVIIEPMNGKVVFLTDSGAVFTSSDS